MRTARTGIDYDALVKDDRVHGRVYTDPTIFEDEIDKIFSRGWVYVGHASEIPQPGDFRMTTIGRQSVIMVRDDDGQVQLLMNRNGNLFLDRVEELLKERCGAGGPPRQTQPGATGQEGGARGTSLTVRGDH